MTPRVAVAGACRVVERIEFVGPTGLRLVGRLIHSDRACAAVMVHGFLSDKEAGGLFTAAAGDLRSGGWGSLRFDLGGSGESDDQVLTPEHARRDVAAAIALMRSLGYRELVLWGHGSMARVCLEVGAGMRAVVITDAALGDAVCDWQRLLRSSTPDRRGRHLLPLQRTSTGLWRQHTVHKALLDYLQSPLPTLTMRCPVLAQLRARGSAFGERVRALGALDKVRLCVVADARAAAIQGAAWIAGTPS